MVEPIAFRNQWVLFGDGSMVQFLRSIDELSDQGQRQKRFLMKPSKDVVFKYKLDSKMDLNEEGFIWRSYPESTVVLLDTDPNHARILVLTDLMGRTTPLTQLYERYTSQINFLQKLHESKVAYIARQQEEMKLMSSNTLAWLSRNIDVVNKAREANSQIRHGPEGDEIDQELGEEQL